MISCLRKFDVHRGNLSYIGPETEGIYCCYCTTLTFERDLPKTGHDALIGARWGEILSRYVIDFDQWEHAKI